MAKPIILADDPEPVVLPPTLYVVRYTDGPTPHSVLCGTDKGRKFFSDRPAEALLFDDRAEAEKARKAKCEEAAGYQAESYIVEPFDSLPADFVEQVRELNPYFKETP